MREIRLYGSEGGGAEANRLSLPLSSSTLRVASPRRAATPFAVRGTGADRGPFRDATVRNPDDAERRRRHSHAGTCLASRTPCFDRGRED
jgi:hypothetical protein